MTTEYKYGTAALDAWAAEGNLTRSRIISGINESLNRYYGLDPEEASALRESFESLSMDESGTRRLTKNALLELLQRNPAFRSSPMSTQAGEIIYESLVYLASAPFEAPPEISKKGLTYDELARALVWTLPERHERIADASNLSRTRTPADHRRLIFQALASTHEADKIPFNETEARRLAEENAFEVEEHVKCFAVTNYDNDGDEMFHDVLDILFARPEVHPWRLLATRDEWRIVAKMMHGEGRKVRDLSIGRDRFKTLVKTLLVLHLEVETGCEGLLRKAESGFESAAASITATFARDPDVGITWPMFDFALKTVAVSSLGESTIYVRILIYPRSPNSLTPYSASSPPLFSIDPSNSLQIPLLLPKSQALSSPSLLLRKSTPSSPNQSIWSPSSLPRKSTTRLTTYQPP